MKKVFLGCCALLFSMVSLAQTEVGRITGRLVGQNSGMPLDYAAVALCSASTHEVVNGTITDYLGTFRIDKLAYGTYEIRCSYVGCTDYVSSPFTLNDAQRTFRFPTIQMDDSAQSLDDVVVTGRRSTYKQSIDKKIFYVGSDIASAAGAVSDLLQNVPSVQVDIEGNVALRGNENVQVLINGKPSVMMRGANRGTVLQQIPASSIERIEVITNPSAQFKPDGTSGIINLIMKKKQAEGLNGSVQANMGNHGRYNGGLALGWSSPTLAINGNYGFRADRRDRWTHNDRTLTDSLTGAPTEVTQRTVSRAPSRSHIGGLGIQWAPTGKDVLEANGSYTYMTFPRTEDNSTVQRQAMQIVKQYNRHRFDNEKQQEAEAAVAYTHTFRKGETLTADYTYALQDEVEDNHYTNSYTLPSVEETADNTLIKQRNDENLIRVLYSNQLNKQNTWVAGYELELDKSDMRYFAEDLLGGTWTKNTTRSNDFLFDERVHSLYLTWEHSQGLFAFMAGLRGEQSWIQSHLLTLHQRVNDRYFMLYPTLHTSYQMNDEMEWQLNYSLRVNRPEGDDLNPFPEYQDLYNVKRGNPYLRPEKIHSLELGWQYKPGATTFIVTPYYRYTYNKMTEITRALEGGVIETTKENMASSSAAGGEFILNSAVGQWLSYNLNSNLFYQTIDASDLGYSHKKSAFAWYASMNADFMLSRTLMFQVNTRYNSQVLTPQGKRLGSFIMNIGAKYDIPKYNLSITSTISDLFDSYKNELQVNTPLLQQRILKRRTPRTFYVGVLYKFGGNSRSKKEQTLQYDESL